MSDRETDAAAEAAAAATSSGSGCPADSYADLMSLDGDTAPAKGNRTGGGGARFGGRCCLDGALQLVLSTPGLVVLVVAYSVMGALIFPALEAPAEQQPTAAVVLSSREECLKELWTITERLNVLYERNWTMLVHEQLRRFEGTIVAATRGGLIDAVADQQPRWTFSEALLYSVTVITTIGHGNLTPRTSEGKVVTMLYALVGVPLMLMCLSSLGGFLAEALQCSYGRLCGGFGRTDRSNGGGGGAGGAGGGGSGGGGDNDSCAGHQRRLADGGSAAKPPHRNAAANNAQQQQQHSNSSAAAAGAGAGCGNQHRPAQRIQPKAAGDSGELNCNVCTQYDAVYSKDTTFDSDRDDSCCLIRQSPAKMAHSTPPPRQGILCPAAVVGVPLNNALASKPLQPLQQSQTYSHCATLPRDGGGGGGGGAGSGKHNLNQGHHYQQQQQPHFANPQLSAGGGQSSAASLAGNHRSQNVYFTMSRMQMLQAPPPPHQYQQRPPTQVHFQPHPPTVHIPPPASFAGNQQQQQQQPIPRYAQLQQMTSSSDSNFCSAPSCSAPAPVPMMTGSSTAATTSIGPSMQLPSNFANNELRVMSQQQQQQHQRAASLASTSSAGNVPMCQTVVSGTGMQHHQHQFQHQQQHQQHHLHHTATVHGLGRSKFQPKPLPPELSTILLEAGDASDAAHNVADDKAVAAATSTSSSAAAAAGGGQMRGGQMSSLETLDDDDDDDPRNGCQHGTPSRIPLIRQQRPAASKQPDDLAISSSSAAAAAAAASTPDDLDQLSLRSGQLQSPQVPVTIVLLILVGYIAIGTVVFAMWENWSIVDGAYFCFVTLSTIGFGDLVPRRTFHGPEIQLFACCVYMVLGLVLVAMTFSLMETKLFWKCRRVAVRLRLTTDD